MGNTWPVDAGGVDAGGVDQAKLLEVLRRASGVPGLGYAARPEPVTGGFWARIYSLRVTGGPPELQRDLILRIMPVEFVARREQIVQVEVVRQGFPAPPIRLAGDAGDGLGGPWMVMDRMPGRPAIPDLAGWEARALPALVRRAVRLPDLLARISARLHALDPVPLERSLSATPDAVANPREFLDLLQKKADGLRGRPDLAAAAAWMRAHPPRPPGRVAICHGDLHPFNLLVDGDRVSLIDWSAAMVADPAYDLAFTSLMIGLAPVELPRALARPVRALTRRGAGYFLRRYRHHAPGAESSLRDDVLAWYGALHCLRALIEAAEWVDDGTAEARAGHPWLTAGPALASSLGSVTGVPCGAVEQR